MSKAKGYIVGLGEVLWDVFPDGAKFGGAPANFACSAADLAAGGYPAAIASAVGADELGERATEELRKRNVDTTWLQVHSNPTGQVDITLDEAGQATYRFADDAAWDNLQWDPGWQQLAESAAAVCFGTLGQRSPQARETIRRFLRNVSDDCLRVCDINLRPPFWDEELVKSTLPLGSLLKCNEEELSVIARLLGIEGETEDVMQQVQKNYGYRLIALTLGGQGSILMDASGQVSRRSAVVTELVDTVGAGDSLTAAVVLGMLNDMPLERLHDWANRVAGYVCSQSGATPGGLPKS